MPVVPGVTQGFTNIVAGNGDVSLAVALGVLAAAPTIAVAIKKLHILDDPTPVEAREIELLDADMPAGWWRRFKEVVPGVAMGGGKLRWHKGTWSVGTDGRDVVITTPMLDEETGDLTT